MKKLYEDDLYVQYEIETQVYGDIFINTKGRPETHLKIRYAYCIYNKKTEEFTVDIVKTDPYFLTPNSREIIKAKVQLIKRSRESKPFENMIEIATG